MHRSRFLSLLPCWLCCYCGLPFVKHSPPPPQSAPGLSESPRPQAPAAFSEPSQEPVFRAGPLPSLQTASGFELPGGGVVPTYQLGSQKYIPVYMTLDQVSFQRSLVELSTGSYSPDARRHILSSQLNRNITSLRNLCSLLNLQTDPDIALGTALVSVECYREHVQTAAGSSNLFPNGFLVTPRSYQKIPKTSALADSSAWGSESAPLLPLKDSPDVFMGLKTIGVPDFIEGFQRDYNLVVDGSSVKVGVVDTGVTLGHPAFLSNSVQPGNTRIIAMKDFTAEGRVYFDSASRFELKKTGDHSNTSANDFLVTADFYFQKNALDQRPQAHVLSSVSEMPIKLSTELSQLLTSGKASARLGVFREALLNGEEDSFDLNKNGDNQDDYWVLYLEDKNGRRYFSIDLTPRKCAESNSLSADFSQALLLQDWNLSHDSLEVYAEKFAIEIKNDELFDAAQNKVPVISASMVGIDPGSHGTHVSGIIGARSLIQNSLPQNRVTGVAAGVKLMINRVCANASGCDSLLGIADLAKNGARVINMSLGGSSFYNDGFGVEETIINRLTTLYDVLFVVSAGNSGPALQTVGSPSTAPTALSVAAAATPEMIAAQYKWPSSFNGNFVLFFSSRGPTSAGGFKPEVAAPGTQLSSVPLNGNNSTRPGLDVFWGTSMAAPMVSGAAALLLDGVSKFNSIHSEKPIHLRSQDLKRVLMASAMPMETTRYFPHANRVQGTGTLTWVDQGAGLINVARAWQLIAGLAEESSSALTIPASPDGQKPSPVEPDYVVRVSQTNPNGQVYDGSQTTSTQDGDDEGGDSSENPAPTTAAEPRYGRGVWLNENALPRMVPVQIIRQLPEGFLGTPTAGHLAAQLSTTADDFALELEIQGSTVPWLSIAGLQSQQCGQGESAHLTLIGGGVNPDPEGAGRTKPFGASTLYLCLNERLVSSLPPGDHGALVRAYRLGQNGKQDAIPAFLIPVYLTKTHAKLNNGAEFRTEKTIGSFEVQRHYVYVPQGTSSVRVTLQVPPSEQGCSAVDFTVKESNPLKSPSELKKKSILRNCDANGMAIPDKNKVEWVRTNPRTGIWEFHVFGRYQFPKSHYKIAVQFLKLAQSVTEAELPREHPEGQLMLGAADSSGSLFLPSASQSQVLLQGFISNLQVPVAQDQELQVLGSEGTALRHYSQDIKSVRIDTSSAPDNDIDIEIWKCPFGKDFSTDYCESIERSAGGTAEESVTFEPLSDFSYVLIAHGFRITQGKEMMQVKEQREAVTPNTGFITIENNVLKDLNKSFNVKFGFLQAPLLQDKGFQEKKYDAYGLLQIKDGQGSLLYEVPLIVK